MTSHAHKNHSAGSAGSISLTSAVAMGTGVMIGAGIFALTGQIAGLAGPWFPLSFIAGAVVTAFSAYSYIAMSNRWPSSGGIAMILTKAYGPGAVAAAASLLMALSMVINESLVARTFATYALRPFGIEGGPLVPIIAVGLILFAYLVNASGNRSVGFLSILMSALKIVGILVFAIAALWAGGGLNPGPAISGEGFAPLGFVGSVALSILAFKGFTTITNSGGEITDPHRNVGRTIMISIAICAVTYLLVALAVGSSLSPYQIANARDYALAEAAEPVLGRTGFYLTVALAMVATASGLIASVFAVSRMLTMLTDMKMIPHSHFGMSGSIRSHMLVYTVVIAGALAVLFDLSRIASLGAFFYLVMDMAVHWGVWRSLRHEVGARGWVLMTALALDAVVLAAFGTLKWQSDPMIVIYAAAGILAVFAYERLFLGSWTREQAPEM
ncbi:APC family permease [Primorskyibacter aestuariivivens]|uniref:APC family permease n=1 Tax=Primorskyibacter aestuariivivens TaxID=1888912 RepID=UPI00230130D3|nr:APC family permease [Primorskyibacter aestuariivivens]MDA7429205.1 APC family permease [Primorskyibacter aestuariivivens]